MYWNKKILQIIPAPDGLKGYWIGDDGSLSTEKILVLGLVDTHEKLGDDDLDTNVVLPLVFFKEDGGYFDTADSINFLGVMPGSHHLSPEEYFKDEIKDYQRKRQKLTP